MRDLDRLLGLLAGASMVTAALAWPAGCARSAEDCASLGLADGCTSASGGSSTTATGGSGGTSTGGSGGTSTGGSGGMNTGGSGGMDTGGSTSAPTVCASRRAGDVEDQQALSLDGRSGQILVGGSFLGTISFGGAQHSAVAESAFVAVLDAATLGPVWSRAMPVGYLAGALDASGDVIIAATYSAAAPVDLGCGPLDESKDFVLARLATTTGACVWSKTMVAPFTSAHLAIAANGDALLAGVVEPGLGGVDLGATGPLPLHGKRDVVVARFDSTGSTLWSRSYGSAEDDSVAGLIVNPTTGAVTIAGDFNGKIDFATAGNALDSAGTRAVFAAQLDSAGASSWARMLNGPGADAVTGIALLPSGLPVIAGTFTISLDVKTQVLSTGATLGGFLVALDADGSTAWARSIDSLGAATISAITAGSSGVALAGSAPIDASNTRLYVTRLGLDGSPISESTIDGAGLTHGTGLVFDGTGLDVAGWFDDKLELGAAGSLASSGKRDVFVLRLCL